jgi:NitT/TauT family transport system substrate-binding protein
MRTANALETARNFALAAIAVCVFAAPAIAQDKVWRHGLINAKSDAGIFLMVSKQDFAAKQGLKIELSQFKDDQIALKALLAGEIDSFEGGPQGVFTANSRGGDVRLLGCHWVVVPHGIYAKTDITKVEQLKGKRIAVSAPNSMPDMLVRSALAAHGVSDKDVSLAAVGGDRERYQALIGGVVDAAVVSNEYEPIAPKDVHLLVAGRDAVPNFLRVCIMSTTKTLAARGDDAVKFLAAEMNALHYALTHKDETVALTREITHAKPDDARPGFVYDDAVEHKAVDPTLPLPAEKLDWIQMQLVNAGKVKEPLNIKSVLAPDYREKALKLTGANNW